MNDNINISVKDNSYINNNDYSIEFNPDNITKIKKDYEDFNNKYKIVSKISKKYDDRQGLLYCISILFAAISCIVFIIIDIISDGKLSKIIPIEYFVIGIFFILVLKKKTYMIIFLKLILYLVIVKILIQVYF